MRERPAQTDREWTSLGGASGRVAICPRGWPHFYSARGSDEHLSRSLHHRAARSCDCRHESFCLDVFVGKSARGRVAIGMGDDCRRNESIPRLSRADGDPKVAGPVRLLVHRRGPPLLRNCFTYLEETVPRPLPLPPLCGQ